MKKAVPVCELPVMKKHCKTCPFKPDENGKWQDVEIANKVVERTLFQAQQICHGTEGKNRKANNRCRGAFDHLRTIYVRMGMPDLIIEETRKLTT